MAENTESSFDYPIPPANFLFLVESILMQTQMHLGLLHLNQEDKDNQPNLPMARHSIDMLAMIQEKTRGNLTVEEQRLLENGLTELRFRFVQVSDQIAKRNEPKLSETKPDDGPKIITADGGKGTKST